MAFTVKEEYERLLKIQAQASNGKISFECGVACGYVTKIEYVPWNIGQDEEIRIYAIAGFDNCEKLVLVLRESDVRKRYQDRKYKYYKRYNILESFVG